jgi:hypothetical protein
MTLRAKKLLLWLAGLLALLVSLLAYDQMRHDKAVYYVGHSLVSFDAELRALSESAGLPINVGIHLADGASLKDNWNSWRFKSGSTAPWDFRFPRKDILVLTERVLPLEETIAKFDPVEHAYAFVQLAASFNPDVQSYMYETWHTLKQGQGTRTERDARWRQRLDDALPLWEGIVDSVNARGLGRPMRIIPAGQAMARLFDEIEAGSVPNLTSIRELFRDQIHLGPLGDFFVACVHFAVLHDRSPQGLSVDGIAPDTAAALQKIAWQVVVDYHRSRNQR